ncbi:MAG: RpiB/LacA/LacB family sugar-phosphate isomerase [Gemmataceae bacterium]
MADSKKILVAADPYAASLKNAVVAHLQARGYEVVDVGADREVPYFDGAVAVCKAMQAGTAPRAVLFCGTGMGMSIVANRFKGVTAAVVESVFAAKMCRAINNANVLCLGQMIWGPTWRRRPSTPSSTRNSPKGWKASPASSATPAARSTPSVRDTVN